MVWQLYLLKNDAVDVSVPVVMASPVSFDWPIISRALRVFYKQHLQHSYCEIPPDHPACSHRKHAVICQWLHPLQGMWAAGSPVLHMSAIDYKQQKLLSRFFTGSTCVATSHHSLLSIDYASCVCHLCPAACLGHEQHVLLHCPSVQHIRAQYPMLDFTLPTLRLFITAHSGSLHLYKFIAAVMRYSCGVPMHPP